LASNLGPRRLELKRHIDQIVRCERFISSHG
jgi:hypothetical protein